MIVLRVLSQKGKRYIYNVKGSDQPGSPTSALGLLLAQCSGCLWPCLESKPAYSFHLFFLRPCPAMFRGSEVTPCGSWGNRVVLGIRPGATAYKAAFHATLPSLCFYLKRSPLI